MTCRELTEHLLDYLSGVLPPEVDADLQQHLDKCPPCVYLMQTYRLTVQITRQLPPAPVPNRCLDRLREALKSQADAGQAS